MTRSRKQKQYRTNGRGVKNRKVGNYKKQQKRGKSGGAKLRMTRGGI